MLPLHERSSQTKGTTETKSSDTCNKYDLWGLSKTGLKYIKEGAVELKFLYFCGSFISNFIDNINIINQSYAALLITRVENLGNVTKN